MSLVAFRNLLRSSWIALVSVPVLVGLFFFRWAPHNGASVSLGDSGIFLYIGQQINNGLIPYADVWDDKGPLLFYLNALGLRLWHGSPLGVVLLAAIFAVTFFAFVWLSVRRVNGTRAALFATLLTINLLPDIFMTPNTVEIYCLAFQAAAFYLMIREFDSTPQLTYAALQGALAAALFQIRPNSAGVSVLYCLACIYCLVRKGALARLLPHAVIFLVSFAGANCLILSQLILRGHLGEYADAVFGFSLHYSSTASPLRHAYAIGVGLLKVSPYGAGVIAGGVALDIIVSLRRKTLAWGDGFSGRHAILASLLFAIEILCSAVSGKAFEHYFAMWLLPVALFAGLFIGKCELLAAAAGADSQRFARAMFLGACSVLAFSSFFESARSYGETVLKFKDSRSAVIQFVRQHSASSDSLFVWGDFGDLSFRIGLRPASRHITSIYAANDPISYRTIGSEALHDVEKSRPRFVLDCAPDVSFPLFSAPRSATELVGGADALADTKERLRESYRLVLNDAASGVKVYELGPPPRSETPKGPS
jgi:hypothetical protein